MEECKLRVFENRVLRRMGWGIMGLIDLAQDRDRWLEL